MHQTISEFFQTTYGQSAEVVARAPGRIEFIGNHVDYNGGKVLGAAINRFVTVAVKSRSDRRLRFVSAQGGDIVEMDLDDLTPRSGKVSWVNYPVGMLHVLIRDGMKVEQGFDFAVTSDLPSGAGLSSSAAFELSTAQALVALYQYPLTLERMVLLAQKAENEFVGVPCGVLDQAVSGFGKQNHLVLIDCREPAFSTLPLPDGVHFWIFNTNLKHSLVDSLYATRHRECQVALRQVQTEFEEAAFLTDINAAQLQALAPGMRADHFSRAQHVIEEHARVEACEEILMGGGDLAEVGRLLFASHDSSRRLFGNSTPELDALVELLAAEPNVWGARLTGGGFGGAVMALTKVAFSEADAERLAAAYRHRLPAAPEPSIFHVTTGDGACRLL
ncbi:MAG: galactokinase [Verrucomicrobia bacterium]|nr:galactokinase [Verrucomicrobiota bacterium]